RRLSRADAARRSRTRQQAGRRASSHRTRCRVRRYDRPLALLPARAGPDASVRRMRPLSVLYRGPLCSCNYACWYCPFAKRTESAAELSNDRAALERFVGWIGANADFPMGILFTPWGEALVRPWYQDALVRLTRLPHVQRAAAQTNGRWPLR